MMAKCARRSTRTCSTARRTRNLDSSLVMVKTSALTLRVRCMFSESESHMTQHGGNLRDLASSRKTSTCSTGLKFLTQNNSEFEVAVQRVSWLPLEATFARKDTQLSKGSSKGLFDPRSDLDRKPYESWQ
jgi:hypothetical protein